MLMPQQSFGDQTPLSQQVEIQNKEDTTLHIRHQHGMLVDQSALLLLASADVEMVQGQNSVLNLPQDQQKKFVPDRVVRVLADDAKPIIKLEKEGLVSLAGIQIPKSYDSSGNCRSYTTPYAKVKQLLPANTPVRVKVMSKNTDSQVHKAIIALESPLSQSKTPSSISTVQGELIRRGFATVKINSALSDDFPGLREHFESLEKEAAQRQSGPLYQTCSATDDDASSFNTNGAPQFEPMEFTMQTDWKVDGGKRVRRVNPDFVAPNQSPPRNPGDTKGCSDFDTYEESLAYYEYYFPFYGDVARLDRDKDGVPCPGLPHTKDMERYRMKIPTASKQQSSS